MGFRILATTYKSWSPSGISQQRRHLDRLVDFSSSDDYSSGHDNYLHGHHSLEGHLQGLGVISGQYSSTDYSSTGEYSTSSNILLAALNIEVLRIITMELILHNSCHPITLMLDPLVNHLNLQDLTHKHIIILMETICLVSILIAGMIMMILCLIVI